MPKQSAEAPSHESLNAWAIYRKPCGKLALAAPGMPYRGSLVSYAVDAESARRLLKVFSHGESPDAVPCHCAAGDPAEGLFRCGHPKSEGNSISGGRGRARCRCCQAARIERRQACMRVLGRSALTPSFRCGHPATPENSYVYSYAIRCRTCSIERAKRFRAGRSVAGIRRRSAGGPGSSDRLAYLIYWQLRMLMRRDERREVAGATPAGEAAA